MISLKYDKFRFYGAVVPEKKCLNSIYAKVSKLNKTSIEFPFPDIGLL